MARRLTRYRLRRWSSLIPRRICATLTYNDGKSNKDKNEVLTSGIEYDGLRVDTLTLKSDFEFPVSYKNMRFSYPTIYIEGVTSKTEANNKGFVFDLVVDKFILKRKD